MNGYRFLYWDKLDAESQNQLSCSPLLAQMNNHYLRNTHSQEYYNEYLGSAYRNRSILVFQQHTPIIALPRLCKDNEINFAGQPSEIISVVDKVTTRKATVALIHHLKKKSPNAGLNCLFDHNSVVIKELAGCITSLNNHYHGYIDLDLPEADYKRAIRKSYKSLINWGEKNFSIRLIDHQAKDFDEFKAFQLLHLNASGKVTRSEATWLKQFEMICAGYGFLVNAYYGDEIISGCYIMKDEQQAFYGVAASRRDLMHENMPLNHFPLYQAVRHCRNLGLKQFIFGNVDLDQNNNGKLENINRFKRGFCTNLSIRHSINVRFGPSSL